MTSQWNGTRWLAQNNWCVAHSTSDFRTENIVSFKEVWLWIEFERFDVFSTIRLKGEMNFFIRKFWEVFYFPSAIIVVA